MMKKQRNNSNMCFIIIIFCFSIFPTLTIAEIKTDYASTSVITTEIKRAQQEAIKHTSNIKTYYQTIEDTAVKEIGFWTALFFIIVFILGTFVAR